MGSGEVQHFWQKTDLRLCRAKRVTYEHLDLRDLEMKLRESRAKVKLIVTDGVFSMDAEVNLRFNFELSLYSLKQQFQTQYNFHPGQDFSARLLPCCSSASWLTSMEPVSILTMLTQLGSFIRNCGKLEKKIY